VATGPLCGPVAGERKQRFHSVDLHRNAEKHFPARLYVNKRKGMDYVKKRELCRDIFE